jgi:putative membrane protein
MSPPVESGLHVDFDPQSITRPDPVLLRYYMLCSVFAGPFFPIAFLPLYFKYITIEYKFDEAGVSMKWGILFRKEINLTYRRIQDIHLTRNLFQRWMGLATVAIQTASGNSGPEMSIEGILESDQLRDYLYAKMRGARGEKETTDGHAAPVHADRALSVLHEIRDLLKSSNAGGRP